MRGTKYLFGKQNTIRLQRKLLTNLTEWTMTKFQNSDIITQKRYIGIQGDMQKMDMMPE